MGLGHGSGSGAQVTRSANEVEELFRTEFPRLVRALTVAFDAEVAADAVQEAFLEANRKWGRIQTYTDPAAWVRRVAINRALNVRRNVRRRHEILASIRPVPAGDLTDSLLDLRAAIDALPERMRLAVCLYYLADLSLNDVADALGTSAGTVKSNLHDARNRLQSTLREERHD